MTTEEKYKEIVESRKVAGEESKEPSGVKVDPPTPKNEHDEEGKAEQQPEAGNEGVQNVSGKSEPTDYEKQQHAMAAMRASHKRETDSLKKEIEELKKLVNAGKEKQEPKKRSDFGSDEEYGEYVRSQITEGAAKQVREELEKRQADERRQNEFNEKLKSGLEGISKGLSEKVFGDLKNPESVMSQIIMDERAKSMVDAIRQSPRMADMLALMQAKPQIFQDILELPPKKQEYRIFSLEDNIDTIYSKKASRQQDDEAKKDRAASLPVTGAFGNQGTGSTDVSALSTEERVARYKAELKKKRL